MTLHLTRYLGARLEIMPDAIGRRYLVATIWFPRRPIGRRLGYLYKSMRLYGYKSNRIGG
jgi:hypothetical protein